MPRLIPLLLVVLSFLAMSADAYALKMCTRRSQATGEVYEGAPIRLRTACKPTEVEVDPVGLGLQGPKGDPGAAGPGMIIRDANDALLGVAQYENGTNARAAITAAVIGGVSRPVWIRVAQNGFLPGGDGVHFESLDCSGQPFVGGGPRDLSEDAVVIGPSNVYGYIAGPGAVAYFASAVPSGSRTTRSVLLPALYNCGTFIPPGGCCQAESMTWNVMPATSLDLQNFAPPFRMETP